MPLVATSQDASFGLQLANVLANFRLADPRTRLDAAVRAMGMDIISAMYIPQTNTRPAAYFADDGLVTFMAVDGAQTLEHGQSYIRCAHQSEFKVAKGWASDGLANFAYDLYQSWLADGNIVRPRMYLTGHSFGGAIATAFMARLINVDDPQKITLITFGAPKAGGSFMAAKTQHADIVRYMNVQDPIPILPPGRLEIGNFNISLGPGDIVHYSRFCHTVGGVSIATNGNLLPTTLSAPLSLPQAISLARWVYTLSVDQASPHSITSYISQLALAVGNQSNVNFPIRPKAQPEGAHPIPRKEAQEFLADRFKQQAPVLREVENTPLKIPRINLASIERSGRLWSVTFGGAIISSGLGKTNDRRLRDSFNTFLRRLQRQGIVDVTTLESQFETYLVLASDPASGFEPQLNNADLG
jgi:hypothetical protein